MHYELNTHAELLCKCTYRDGTDVVFSVSGQVNIDCWGGMDECEGATGQTEVDRWADSVYPQLAFEHDWSHC